MVPRCLCKIETSSNYICIHCGRPICSQCAQRVLNGSAIRLYHFDCEPDQEKISEYGEPLHDAENDEGHLMGEGYYITPSEKYRRKRELFESENWEDRIKAATGIEELWFKNHDAEPLGLYIKGMKDRSDRVKIAFLRNFDELFQHRNNREARLQFIRDITKNLIVQNLISTISKLLNSKNEEVKNLALLCLLRTMDIIHPTFKQEFYLKHLE